MRTRNVGFILIGIAVLMFKSHYSGPFAALVQSYAGNVAVSFAVYFLALYVPIENKCKGLMTMGIALAAVELFEVFDGFGIMSNVYDDLDLVANIVGVVVAFATDTTLALSIRNQQIWSRG